MPEEQNERMGWASRAIPGAAALAAAAVAVRDLRQRKHALLRNYPLLGHARYMLESIGPELRQYLVAGNNEERPFTRDQRRWVYASAKKENNYFGFGTDNDIEYTAGYPIIQSPHLRPRHPALLARGRVRGRAALRQNLRSCSRPPARVPSAVRRQHRGDELRFVVGQRRRRS
jgi:glutamate synthase domain-containing protein 2